MKNLKQYRQTVNNSLTLYRSAIETVKSERSLLMEAENNLISAEEAREVLQSISQHIQQEVHSRIASVVTRCLSTVFDDPYEFRIRFEKKRNKTEAVLEFVRGGLILDDPLRQLGGGVIDVASFALRLACLMITRPAGRRLLVLDEPFSKIRGVENRQRIRNLVVQLSEEVGVQFIINVDVDAYPEFELGTVVAIGE